MSGIIQCLYFSILLISLSIIPSTLESPLDCKESQPVHPKGDQSWVFIGRTDAEAETPILRPSDAKTWLIWKDPDVGKDWGLEENGTREDEMVGWCHQLSKHGFGWTLEVGDGQGGLACCSSWGRKESDMTERLNWTNTLKVHPCFHNWQDFINIFLWLRSITLSSIAIWLTVYIQCSMYVLHL